MLPKTVDGYCQALQLTVNNVSHKSLGARSTGTVLTPDRRRRASRKMTRAEIASEAPPRPARTRVGPSIFVTARALPRAWVEVRNPAEWVASRQRAATRFRERARAVDPSRPWRPAERYRSRYRDRYRNFQRPSPHRETKRKIPAASFPFRRPAYGVARCR